MKFTDIFIRRPVLASVVSLMLLVIGLKAFYSLPILEYPKTENAVVTITTVYYGADPETVAGFVTTPLENAIAQANGIDTLASNSGPGISTITANLVLNFDPDKAITEITAKINSVLNQLPQGVQQPTLSVAIGQSLDALIIGFASDDLSPNQITDYLVRNVQPRLQAVPGVQTAELLGGQNFALRAWLDPAKLAGYGLTATDVTNALSANNVIAGIGNTKGEMVQFNLTASTNLHSVQQFRDLVIKQVNGGIIRLSDVAHVTLGSDDYESSVEYNGKKGVYIGIQTVPSASLLAVIDGVKAVLPSIQQQLPAGLHGDVIYDSTVFVNSSIHEVERSLAETVLIVTLVVFAFLGSPRSVVIPVITIPLSLIGTFAVMLALGFSINLLSLLALVLAIGLVVDDAIIVVESVNRHLEDGMRPRDAAMQAARELANPIIAMTAVLVAVYVPIGFQGGLTGALFTEFAFTVVGAVTMSAIVALTLSPMMCGFLLKPHSRGVARGWSERLTDLIDRGFSRLRALVRAPAARQSAHAAGDVAVRRAGHRRHLLPVQQRQQRAGAAGGSGRGHSAADLRARCDLATKGTVRRSGAGHHVEGAGSRSELPGLSPTLSIAGITLKPWDQRTRDATTIQRQLQGQLNVVAGQKIAAFLPPALPGAQGLPIQFVLKSSQPIADLYPLAQKFLADATDSGMFLFIDSDLKIDSPQLAIEIDRDKAAQLGLSMTQVGTASGRPAGRRLYQLLQPGHAVLQSDFPGATAVAADDRSGDAVSDRDDQRHADPGVRHRHGAPANRAAVDHAFPAAEFRHDLRRPGAWRVAGGRACKRCATSPRGICRATC